MALTPLKLPVTASTQDHLTIADIRDDVVILEDGGVAMILETTAVNFGLLSETEQDAAIYAYAGLLNSLTFPVQIVIRSRQMDISSYVKLLKEQEEKQTNENLRFQIGRYRQFIESIIRENNVLDKRFYIVVPFSPLELGVPRAAASLIRMLNPLKKAREGLPYPKDYILEKAKNALYPKKDHIARQLARIGLRAEQLTVQQLVELFYDIYNPTQISSQKITASASDYTTPLVGPAVEEESKKAGISPKASVAPSSVPTPEPPKSSEGVSPTPSATTSQTLSAQSSPLQSTTPLPQQAPETKTPPSPLLPSQPSTTLSEAEPEWIKRVQQKVEEDKGNQPRLVRTQPQSQQKDQPKIIGGRVATSPGGVSQQTRGSTFSPSPKDVGEADKGDEKTIFES